MSVCISVCLSVFTQLQVYSTVHWCSVWEISSRWDWPEPTSVSICLSLSVSMSVCLYLCLYVYLRLSVCLFSYKSIVQYIDAQYEKYLHDETGLNWRLSLCVSVCISVSLSVYMSIYVYVSLCLSVFSYKSIVQYIDAQYEKYLHDETGLNRRLSLCVSVCLSICLSMSVSICLSMPVSVSVCLCSATSL